MTTVKANPFVEVVAKCDEDDDRYILRNIYRNESFDIPNVGVVSLLGIARDWTERAELVTTACDDFGLPESKARTVVEMLEGRQLLVTRDAEEVALEQEKERWREQGLEAEFEYLVTIWNYPFYEDMDPDSGLQRVEERASKLDDVPSVYKGYPDAELVELPTVEESASFGSIRSLLGSAAPSEDGPRAVDRTFLAELLYYTFGETGRQRLPNVGEFLLKTSPSGGSRHPIEAYVITTDVENLPDGVYHYSVEEHELERIGDEESSIVARNAMSETPDRLATSSLFVVFTAVLERNMWKYRDPQAYRVPYYDIGHLQETMRLLCRSQMVRLDFGHVANRQTVAETLALHRSAEPILGYAVVG